MTLCELNIGSQNFAKKEELENPILVKISPKTDNSIDDFKVAIPDCVLKDPKMCILANEEADDGNDPPSIAFKPYTPFSTLYSNHPIVISEEDSKLFYVDTKPCPNSDVPLYELSTKHTLGADLIKNSEEKKDVSIKKTSTSRNQTNLNNSKIERYHFNICLKFEHIQPGQISDVFRSAMKIKKWQIPSFFYRMRVLGYPPAWLEEARIPHSGIHIFDAMGNQVRDPYYYNAIGDGYVEKQKYDVSKIIRFPGFNYLPGPRFYDDYKYHRVPQYRPRDDINEFIKSLGNKVFKGYRRNQLKYLPENVKEINCKDDYTLENMNMQDVSLYTDDDTNDSKELALGSQVLISNPTDSEQKLRIIDVEALTEDLPEAIIEVATEQEIIEGTPILNYTSEHMPHYHDFKKGISDVIYFENLHNSGSYQQMKKVINRVREIIPTINQDDFCY